MADSDRLEFRDALQLVRLVHPSAANGLGHRCHALQLHAEDATCMAFPQNVGTYSLFMWMSYAHTQLRITVNNIQSRITYTNVKRYDEQSGKVYNVLIREEQDQNHARSTGHCKAT